MHAFAHVTGGGLALNLARVLPPHADAVLDRAHLAARSPCSACSPSRAVSRPQEMERVFNMGVGMVAVVGAHDADPALSLLASRGVPAWLAGEITAGAGAARLPAGIPPDSGPRSRLRPAQLRGRYRQLAACDRQRSRRRSIRPRAHPDASARPPRPLTTAAAAGSAAYAADRPRRRGRPRGRPSSRSSSSVDVLVKVVRRGRRQDRLYRSRRHRRLRRSRLRRLRRPRPRPRRPRSSGSRSPRTRLIVRILLFRADTKLSPQLVKIHASAAVLKLAGNLHLLGLGSAAPHWLDPLERTGARSGPLVTALIVCPQRADACGLSRTAKQPAASPPLGAQRARSSVHSTTVPGLGGWRLRPLRTGRDQLPRWAGESDVRGLVPPRPATSSPAAKPDAAQTADLGHPALGQPVGGDRRAARPLRRRSPGSSSWCRRSAPPWPWHARS